MKLIVAAIRLFAALLILGASFLLHGFAQDNFAYDDKGKRDPFIPLVTSEGRLLNLDREENKFGILLEGIIYDKSGSSYAVINGQIVKVGDEVGEYQVLKIEKSKVTLIKQGEPYEVELKEE